MDLAIRNATVIDGAGAPPNAGDNGIAGGRVAAVSKVDGDARVEIGAAGAIAASGFIE